MKNKILVGINMAKLSELADNYVPPEKEMKKRYQQRIMLARMHLKVGKYFEVYDILGAILEDMEKP